MKYSLEKSGFTLVEILIAAGVLSLFLTGLFQFYRMGGQMFSTGSWKLQKQKEAERFLATLKERIEQASNASRVQPGAGARQLVVSKAPFLAPNDGQELTTSVTEKDTRLLMFSVCKPDMSLVPGQKAGLILHHCLLARKNSDGLFDLYFHANTTTGTYAGIDFFSTSETYGPDLATFTHLGNPSAKFTATPADYSLQNVPFLLKMTELAGASFTLEVASGTSAEADTEKVVGINLSFRHPRYKETTVFHGIKAKIDYSVPVKANDLGDF